NCGEEVDIGDEILVVGGGNTAIDVARTVKRLGKNVTLVYRRSRNEMPAEQHEIDQAEEEGVNFSLLCNPIRCMGDRCVNEVELIEMELGEPDASGRRRPIPCEGSNYCIPADNVVMAIGQVNDQELLDKFGLDHERGWLEYNETTYESNLRGVFIGGDLATGPSIVIEAIDSGRKAAYMIDLYVNDELNKMEEILEKPWEYLDELESNQKYNDLLMELKPYYHWKDVTEKDYEDRERIPRIDIDMLPPKERAKTFDEVEKTISEEKLKEEVKRCMSCGCMAGFDCKLREYATYYGAKQDGFAGEVNKYDLDESHPFVTFDANKCILCGQCINLTQEITGEGLLANFHRGFNTEVSPSLELNLEDLDGQFIGQFVDVCPTGAFSYIPPLAKPGPWATFTKSTICNGCPLACEMEVVQYKDFIIGIRGSKDTWNHGLVCDIPRFERPWEKSATKATIKTDKSYKTISKKEAKKIAKKHSKDLAIILTPEVTIEEAKAIQKFAKEKGYKIGALYGKGLSTAKFEDILSSKRLKVDVDVKKYPVLKALIHLAKREGTEIVKKDYDLAIVSTSDKRTEDVPTIIMHEGLNDVGLQKLELSTPPKANNYLLIGSYEHKFVDYTMIIGENQSADLRLPYPSWIAREGTIINSSNKELKVQKIIEQPSLLERLEEFFG
ncbi:glutamate synthase, partial [Candidatus Heimdallarchaeota archaeon]